MALALTPWTEIRLVAVSRNATQPDFSLLKPVEPRARSNEAVGSSLKSKASEVAAPAPEDEREWIERARGGDAAAFRCLVERYRDQAYGLALRMLGSPAEAEEMAQDGFVRAWRGLPQFRGDAAFATWLHRIVIRRALDRSAALKVRRARATSLEEAAQIAAPAEAAEPGGSALARRPERLIASLSGVQRAVVALYYYEDRSVEEVADTLGVPTGTVKTHLHRARAALRDGWEREEPRGGGA